MRETARTLASEAWGRPGERGLAKRRKQWGLEKWPTNWTADMHGKAQQHTSTEARASPVGAGVENTAAFTAPGLPMPVEWDPERGRHLHSLRRMHEVTVLQGLTEEELPKEIQVVPS